MKSAGAGRNDPTCRCTLPPLGDVPFSRARLHVHYAPTRPGHLHYRTIPCKETTYQVGNVRTLVAMGHSGRKGVGLQRGCGSTFRESQAPIHGGLGWRSRVHPRAWVVGYRADGGDAGVRRFSPLFIGAWVVGVPYLRRRFTSACGAAVRARRRTFEFGSNGRSPPETLPRLRMCRYGGQGRSSQSHGRFLSMRKAQL